VLRSYRYPLRPTVAQEAKLDQWRIACCDLYNGALEERRETWRRQRYCVTFYDQQRELVELRHSVAEWESVPSDIARSALRRLDRSFKDFRRRLRRGEDPGPPRYRGVDHYKSFSLGDRHRIVENRLHVPKLGWVKLHLYRPLGGPVRDVVLKKEAGGWFAYVVCDIGAAPPKGVVHPNKIVGIDVGLNVLAVLSDGGAIENPRYMKKSEVLLARRQQAYRRKRPGSRSHARAVNLVARMRQHIGDQRLDYARKTAKQLINNYDLIVHEDLQIARMVRGNFAKSIHDAGWGILLRCIASKAEEAGKHVIAVDPRGTSQRCSMCGKAVAKDLSVRVHACPNCGYTADRDLNAARNILALGRSVVAVA